MNNLSTVLRRARKLKPACFTCKSGCYECCTRVEFLPEEKERMDECLFSKGYTEPPEGKWKDYCEYLDENAKCVIHEERPMICRAYWVVKEHFLTCSHFENEQWKNPEIESRWVKDTGFSQALFNYMEEIIKTGIKNKNGEKFDASNESANDPWVMAKKYWAKGYLALAASAIIQAKDNPSIPMERVESILTNIELALKTYGDSLMNYPEFKKVIALEK